VKLDWALFFPLITVPSPFNGVAACRGISSTSPSGRPQSPYFHPGENRYGDTFLPFTNEKQYSHLFSSRVNAVVDSFSVQTAPAPLVYDRRPSPLRPPSAFQHFRPSQTRDAPPPNKKRSYQKRSVFTPRVRRPTFTTPPSKNKLSPPSVIRASPLSPIPPILDRTDIAPPFTAYTVFATLSIFPSSGSHPLFPFQLFTVSLTPLTPPPCNHFTHSTLYSAPHPTPPPLPPYESHFEGVGLILLGSTVRHSTSHPP